MEDSRVWRSPESGDERELPAGAVSAQLPRPTHRSDRRESGICCWKIVPWLEIKMEKTNFLHTSSLILKFEANLM